MREPTRRGEVEREAGTLPVPLSPYVVARRLKPTPDAPALRGRGGPGRLGEPERLPLDLARHRRERARADRDEDAEDAARRWPEPPRCGRVARRTRPPRRQALP